MEKAIKFGTTLRNNWKKSVLGALALSYGAALAKEKYEIALLMKAACKEAVQFGDSLIPIDRNPTLVTIILNPVANKRKAKKEFEKYCEPLFHLAGLQIDVIQTASEGNAKEIAENLRGTEAIVVAGGDGTLSETVTGLLRRNDDANQFPLGVLPLGRTNTLGNTMFQPGQGVMKVKQLIDATMAIIHGKTTWKDAMKIEPLPQDDEVQSRPIYALSSIEWGAFRDAMAKRDKYWFLGSLREYAAFLFNGYKNSLTWNCSGTLKYTPPCAGCSNCMARRPEVKRKWSFFMPSQSAVESSKLAENPECMTSHELCFKTCDFKIRTPNLGSNHELPALNIVLGKNSFTYTGFVAEGWNRLKDKTSMKESIQRSMPVRTVELFPQDVKEGVIEIDKEEFDVKPIKITLLPKVVKLFSPEINVM